MKKKDLTFDDFCKRVKRVREKGRRGGSREDLEKVGTEGRVVTSKHKIL
jgi:hypothetical protein